MVTLWWGELGGCRAEISLLHGKGEGLGIDTVEYLEQPGMFCQGCRAWLGHQELVTPSPGPGLQIVCQLELESPRQVLILCAETPVLKCSPDAVPDPARELREPLLLLLPR